MHIYMHIYIYMIYILLFCELQVPVIQGLSHRIQVLRARGAQGLSWNEKARDRFGVYEGVYYG